MKLRACTKQKPENGHLKMEHKTVVFVGGGYATMEVIKALASQRKREANVALVLVDPKEAFLHNVATPRAAVSAQFAATCFTPYEQFWPAGVVTHIRAKAVAVRDNAVELSSGSTLLFDVLVLAPGLSYAPPFRAVVDDELPGTTAAQLEAMARVRDSLAAAEHVIVVGGGATGCETAAEVKVAFPEKKVTLMHSRGRLLDQQKEMPAEDAVRVKEKLERLGVRVQLETVFREAEAGAVVLRCTGGTPQTRFLPHDVLDEKGFIRTDNHLLVAGRANVFAIGDAVAGAAPTLKTAIYLHAPVVAANVRNLLRGEAPTATVGQLWGVIDSFLVVTLGPNDSYSHGIGGAFYASSMRKDFRTQNMIKSFTVQ
jgi:NADH dehydrogenase FAD-containing subunit